MIPEHIRDKEALAMQSIETIEDLEAVLSCPTPGALNTLRKIDGDVIVLGAGGKMGPTLARMLRRGLDEIGQPQRRVIAVSRFSSADARLSFEECRVETITCDLLDRNAVHALPDVKNVIFMAGQKFGTSQAPEATWAMNTLVPANVAELYCNARIVVFSTGCVYPLVPASGPGANEDSPLCPPGEYSNSCVGRERIFGYFAKQHATRLLFFRLCYAIELRYGVLNDVAHRVAMGEPVDLTMGAVNVIWQGDASARAIESLAHTASPPIALNVTGMERISIRWLANRFAELLGRSAVFTGVEGESAWLWDASRSYELFGPPTVSLEEMIAATVQWVQHGGARLCKPTGFEVANGQF